MSAPRTSAEPDFGLLTQTETVAAAQRICRAVACPVMVDVDTGYGNALNVCAPFRDYERAGAAGIFLEDQVWPKRCGHMRGKRVIPAETGGKIRGRGRRARRRRPRSSSRAPMRAAVEGLDEAIARARATATPAPTCSSSRRPTSEDDIARVAGELAGVAPLVVNWAEGGRTPPIPLARIAELGFALVLFPIGALLAATAGIRALLRTLRADGTPAAAMPGLPSFGEFTDLIGLPEITELERRFAGSIWRSAVTSAMSSSWDCAMRTRSKMASVRRSGWSGEARGASLRRAAYALAA